MITSPMSASFISGEPIVLVPTHSMPTSTPSTYYFGNTVRLGPQTMHAMPPYFDAGHFGLHSSQNTPPQFAPLPIVPHNHMHHSSNDMVVDETAPLSPSSSNSTDLEDEESAAAILHALESASLSPRGSSFHNPLHSASRSMKQHRRMAVSPIHGRRKRVASLSEVQDASMSSTGKESAEEFDDEYGGNDLPQTPSALPHATSWSLPSQSGLGFSGFSSYGTSVTMPRVAGASSTMPIAIPRSKPFSAFHHHAGSPTMMTLGSGAATTSSHKKGNKRQSRARLDNHQCPNCHTSDSPLWRNCLIKGKILHLCNSCGLRYKKHKYCPHCYKVYYDADTNVHDWAQCGSCHNWTHRQCLSDANIDVSVPGAYKCLRCLGLLPDCD